MTNTNNASLNITRFEITITKENGSFTPEEVLQMCASVRLDTCWWAHVTLTHLCAARRHQCHLACPRGGAQLLDGLEVGPVCGVRV